MANYTSKRKYTKKTATVASKPVKPVKTVKLGKKVLPVVVPAKKTLTEKVISWLKNLI
jgi:reverse gyrase